MKRSKYSDSLWSGVSQNDSPHGTGILFTQHPILGKIPLFQGLMHSGRFVSGTLFQVTGTTVYKSFEGDFDGQGTLYDLDGIALFAGPFRNGRPWGFGTGTVHVYDFVCDFSGTYQDVYKTGTLCYETTRFIGDLHPLSGLPCGKGLYVNGDICLDGVARLEGDAILFQAKGPFPDFVDSWFPKIRYANGSFQLTSYFSVCLHGTCAIVFSCGPDLLKVVGTFDMDSILSGFDVYRIDESDAVFSSEILTTGTKLAHIEDLYADTFLTKFQLFEDSKKVYDGTGLFSFKRNSFSFFEDGLGTTFDNGVSVVTGLFEFGTLQEIQIVYDTSGHISWILTEQGPVHDTGKLNGTGTVFSDLGDPMYSLTFDNGTLLGESQFWSSLSRIPYKADGEDPITKESFRKGRLGIRLGSTVYSLKTLRDYWKHAGFGKDPLSDRYVFRVELLKFT